MCQKKREKKRFTRIDLLAKVSVLPRNFCLLLQWTILSNRAYHQNCLGFYLCNKRTVASSPRSLKAACQPIFSEHCSTVPKRTDVIVNTKVTYSLIEFFLLVMVLFTTVCGGMVVHLVTLLPHRNRVSGLLLSCCY